MTVEHIEGGGTVFEGIEGVALYRAIVLKHGLTMYLRTGIKPNTAWTRRAMLLTAARITGKPYVKGGNATIREAITDLEEWIANQTTTRNAPGNMNP